MGDFLSSWQYPQTNVVTDLLWNAAPTMLMWSIWIERNHRIFRTKSKNMDTLWISFEKQMWDIMEAHISSSVLQKEDSSAILNWDQIRDQITKTCSGYPSLPAMAQGKSKDETDIMGCIQMLVFSIHPQCYLRLVNYSNHIVQAATLAMLSSSKTTTQQRSPAERHSAAQSFSNAI